MNRTINYTFNPTTLGDTPALCNNGYYELGGTIPTDEIFNKVFYMKYEDKITAFKIVAWAGSQYEYGALRSFYFLVKFPNKNNPVWIHQNRMGKWFTSVENLINGVNEEKLYKSICITDLKGLKDIHDVYYAIYDNTIRFNKLWFMDSDIPKNKSSKITHIIGVPNQVIFGLYNYQGYESRDALLKATYNNMEIVDFADTITYELKFEITPTTPKVRKVHILD